MSLFGVLAVLTVYWALVALQIQYCCVIWGNSYKTHTQSILPLQKKAVRIIHKVNHRAHTKQLFIKSKLLKLHDLIKYRTVQIMFKAGTPEPLNTIH